MERKYGDEKNVKPSIISNVYKDNRGYEEIDDDDTSRMIQTKKLIQKNPTQMKK